MSCLPSLLTNFALLQGYSITTSVFLHKTVIIAVVLYSYMFGTPIGFLAESLNRGVN
jgi:hypothetical protein